MNESKYIETLLAGMSAIAQTAKITKAWAKHFADPGC